MALVGPEGSGKSHLAAIWAEQAGARSSPRARSRTPSVPAALATGALVVEDAAAAGFDETAMFHLLNLAREEGAYRAAHRADGAADVDDPDAGPRVAAARHCRWSRWRRRTMRCCGRCW